MIENYVFDYIDEPMLAHTFYAASINCLSDREIKISKHKNVIIDPLCVLGTNQIVLDYATLDISHYEVEDNPVIFLGTWYNVWGHLITDTLSKFWFIDSDEYFNKQLNNCDILFNIENKDLPSQFYELLEIIGIDKSRLRPIEKPLLCKNLYVPDDSIFVEYDKTIAEKDADKKNGLYFYTKEFYKLIDIIKKSTVEDKQIDKVFFKTPTSSKFIGSKNIEFFFKSIGYEIISPHKITFKEQLSIIANCNFYCAIEGSISFNSLFLNSNANLVILRKLPYIVPYQFMINQIANAKVTYIDTHMSIFCDRDYPYLGPFLFYPSQNLYNYLGISKEPYLSLLILAKYILRAIKLQNERVSFILNVKWEIDMYYFRILNKLLKNNVFAKIFIKLINKL